MIKGAQVKRLFEHYEDGVGHVSGCWKFCLYCHMPLRIKALGEYYRFRRCTTARRDVGCGNCAAFNLYMLAKVAPDVLSVEKGEK